MYKYFLVVKYRMILCIGLAVMLSACAHSGGASNISGKDKSTFVGSLGFDRLLTENTAVEFRYVASVGNSSQSVNEFQEIQLNGTRLNGPISLQNRYSLQALSATYRYHFYSGERLKLGVSPSGVLTYASLSSKAESLDSSFSDFRLGVGFRLNGSYKLTNKYSIYTEYGAYYLGDEKYWYNSAGVFFTYDWTSNIQLKLGKSISSLGESRGGNDDNCGRALNNRFNDAPVVCSDSEYDITSGGVQLGVKYKW